MSKPKSWNQSPTLDVPKDLLLQAALDRSLVGLSADLVSLEEETSLEVLQAYGPMVQGK
jgi:hypothetical protein